MERYVELLKYGFKFKKFEPGTMPKGLFAIGFDDSQWDTVRVPHDWAINGPFGEEYDKKKKTAVVDGERRIIEQTGRTGGLPSMGQGVYRKWISVPKEDEGKRIFLELDGVMWTSEVYVNGIKMGSCHFGYRSYDVEITAALRFGEDNLIAVYAEVGSYACRWYTGGGIYRNLRLVKKAPSHIKKDGVWVRPLCVGADSAIFEVSAELENAVGFDVQIFDPSGKLVSCARADKNVTYIEIEDPQKWDVDAPNLYTAKVNIASGDCETVRLGVRTSKFTPNGYYLNGRYLKINGVCMHHDLGSLGSAVNTAALRRQIEILKGMGVNSIRTSHNPPSPELLELCDEMGILVMDEFFDEWVDPKVENGYAKYFKEHACKDVVDTIRRDRNHPCIVMWSIGNEIREQWTKDGAHVCKLLADCVHAEDPTRPVTAGISAPIEALDNRLVLYLDVVGLNYKPHLYKEWHEKFPDMIIVGSETESCVSTRGVYHFPAVPEIPVHRDADLAVSAYELGAPSWAYYAERELAAQKDCDFVLGEYIWTGFDYLGEPTPYFEEWPSRSSYFGVVDLAGLPKNRYFLYRSVWTKERVLHVFPHWTWHGKEGQTVPVHVFTNYPEVELFINGVSQGKRRHGTENEIERFRLMWNETVYEPGELVAVAYCEDGNEADRVTIKTAGVAKRIVLEAYKSKIQADGDDLNYITASIVDENGTLCETQDTRLTFCVEGAGELLTTDAGDQREIESFARPDKRTLGGKLVACVRSILGKSGKVTVSCRADGLESAVLEFESLT